MQAIVVTFDMSRACAARESCDAEDNDCDGAVDEANGAQPLCSLPSAESSCEAGECRVAACLGSTADCDGEVFNGCEISLQDDEANCGSCGVVCGANYICELGECRARGHVVSASTAEAVDVGGAAFEFYGWSGGIVGAPGLVFSDSTAEIFGLNANFETSWTTEIALDECDASSPARVRLVGIDPSGRAHILLSFSSGRNDECSARVGLETSVTVTDNGVVVELESETGSVLDTYQPLGAHDVRLFTSVQRPVLASRGFCSCARANSNTSLPTAGASVEFEADERFFFCLADDHGVTGQVSVARSIPACSYLAGNVDGSILIAGNIPGHSSWNYYDPGDGNSRLLGPNIGFSALYGADAELRWFEQSTAWLASVHLSDDERTVLVEARSGAPWEVVARASDGTRLSSFSVPSVRSSFGSGVPHVFVSWLSNDVYFYGLSDAPVDYGGGLRHVVFASPTVVAYSVDGRYRWDRVWVSEASGQMNWLGAVGEELWGIGQGFGELAFGEEVVILEDEAFGVRLLD